MGCLSVLSHAVLVSNTLGIFAVRYVRANDGSHWNRRWANVSFICAGESIRLEAIDDGIWNIDFGPVTLGRLLEQHRRIEDHLGMRKRRLSPMSRDLFVADLSNRSDCRLNGAGPAGDITVALSRLLRPPGGGRCGDAATSTAPPRRGG